ncbi:MAG: hypothetical protein VCC20_05510 [Myxococcota bacterium]
MHAAQEVQRFDAAAEAHRPVGEFGRAFAGFPALESHLDERGGSPGLVGMLCEQLLEAGLGFRRSPGRDQCLCRSPARVWILGLCGGGALEQAECLVWRLG